MGKETRISYTGVHMSTETCTHVKLDFIENTVGEELSALRLYSWIHFER